MRKIKVVAATTAALLGGALALPMTAPTAGASPSAAPAPVADRYADTHAVSDNLTRPWRQKYEDVRQAAIEKRLRTGGDSAAERVGSGKFGKVAQTGKDKIFVVIAEFGNTEHSAYPDGDSNALRVNGPLHNQIPRPDRSVDNTTVWQADYNRGHYDDMYFNRMRKFYEHQSMGRYTIDGDVTQWVKVPFNEARYGRDFCDDIVCNNTWFLVRDGLAYWVKQQLDAGQTMAQIRQYLRTFDHQDRYDFDEDGDFDEPDGFIDHFQIVHAGGDQADGDPTYGTDAIWSHRWNAQIEPFGTGPVGGAQIGGVNVGEGGVSDPNGANVQIPDHPTGVWVNDYTIQPENGGVSVFAHEFAHDLGLPDLYDTSGNTGGAENSVGFWSLMSQSRGTGRNQDGIGDRAMSFGAWDKFQLGWLNYDVARAGRTSEHRLHPNSADGTGKNGLLVLLPNKHVPLLLGDPCDGCGERYFYSDSGDNLSNTMTRDVAGGGPLTAQVRYEIEAGYDYAFLEASSDGGDTWDPIDTNLSSGDEGAEEGISGDSGGQWVDLTATVPTGTDTLRFRYQTDSGVALSGFQVDQITLGGDPIGTAEEPEGWAFDGFRTTTGTEDQSFLNAYVVDNRQYVGNDKLLAHLYNNNSFLPDLPDWVEFFANEPGMLVSYWDTSFSDNNVGEHPGGGEILPVDAHPTFTHTPDGEIARPRTLTYDSPFGLEPTGGLRLHQSGEPYRIPSERGYATFNDLKDYWYSSDEHGEPHPGHYQPGWYSVDVPNSGTTIKVVDVNANGVMTVRVGVAH